MVLSGIGLCKAKHKVPTPISNREVFEILSNVQLNGGKFLNL